MMPKRALHEISYVFFLNGDIGEMYERIVNILQVIVIFRIAESREPMGILHIDQA